MELQAVHLEVALVGRSAATAEQRWLACYTRSSLIWKEGRPGSYGSSITEDRDVPFGMDKWQSSHHGLRICTWL